MPKLNYIKTNAQFNNENKTVLFLHGWGGSANSFLFAQKKVGFHYNTISVDFFGFGKSDYPNKPMDTYLYALSIYEFLLKQNIKSVCIVAHSFGGRIAILLSSVFNIKVEKLILISSAGIKPLHGLLYHFRVYSYKFSRWLVKKNLLNSGFLQKFGSSDYKQLNQVMKKSFIQIVNQNLLEFLTLIKTETLIVWGKKDKSTPFSMAKKMHKNIKGSDLLVYKKSGHFCYLENANSFTSSLLWFLNSTV